MRRNGKIVGNGARDVPIAANSGSIGKICNFAERGGAAAIAHSDFSKKSEQAIYSLLRRVCGDVGHIATEQSEVISRERQRVYRLGTVFPTCLLCRLCRHTRKNLRFFRRGGAVGADSIRQPCRERPACRYAIISTKKC